MKNPPGGADIRAVREALGLTPRALGFALYLSDRDPGRHVRRLENDVKKPSGPLVRALEALAKDADVSVPWKIGAREDSSLGKITSLSVWLNRKAPYGERTTESEAAATRCWVKFKIAHKRAMDERDGLVKPDTRTPRPWPPVADGDQ